ncbi:mechanosensitive ion channel [filamentous cyanobacterium LEGE 11480]|uniref:Mechanosensitive ion channel n=1 Tax=Romeriopsis navalis LEGE 11480 TaxID=2777977 RepID=A0A928VSB4_9CYAN|nr:mechanosensitive ion channel [Romeriopsis navalis]MBE9031645.1 mechanosensitive ion channel [Romeriopsis navalis LEGE 11480]
MNSLSPLMETVAGGALSFPDALSFGNSMFPLAFIDAIPKDAISNGIALLLNILGAVIILVLGWIISGFVAGIFRKLLQKTTIDDKLSNFMSGGGRTQFSVENIVVLLIGWIIKILAIVAALNVLNLNTVSEPLNNFLNQVFAFLPRLGSAAALIGVAWVVATLVKGLVVQAGDSFDLDARLNSASAENTLSATDTLGNALYWFVFLFFLPMILGVLGLEGPLAPVQGLLDQFLSAIPQIIKAVAVGAVGWFIATIVRNVVTNLLAATGVDNIGSRVGISNDSTGQSLSSMGGLVVYIFILIPAIIAALRELNISAISDPATNMLGQFMAAIPLIFTAGIIMTVSYFVGKLLSDLAASLLSGFGFDGMVGKLGVTTPEDSAQTPSQVVGTLVLVATMLVAAVAAVDVLNLPAFKTLVTGLLQIAGQVAVGVAIFGAGLFLANWVAELIKSTGVRESNLLSTAARVAIMIFSGAMALRQIGVATDIVNLTFGLLLGAMAVAIAIAFGLGGRDVAGEQLRDWVKPFKR